MRFALSVVAFLVLASFAYPSDCVAVERTAYLFRADDRSLVSVPLPAPNSGLFAPTIIASFDWAPIGSALHPDGRILTMNSVTDELVAVTPATGEVEVLSVLSEDIPHSADLFWGIDGSLMCMFRVPTQTEFHRIDPATGAMTLQGTDGESFKVVASHEGRYYGWDGMQFWDIDPQTFDVTLIVEIPQSPYFSHIAWGLTSIAGDLWTGITYSGVVFSDSYVYTMDPFAGQSIGWVEFVELVGDETFTALEVIEQPSPAEVSTLQPIGFLALILALVVAGVLVLWRR